LQTGDMSRPRRLQGAFVSEKEVREVVKFISEQAIEENVNENAGMATEAPAVGGLQIDLDGGGAGADGGLGDGGGDDPLYNDAKAVVVQAGKASASLLQRRLKVGYARAARLLDLLEENSVIGPGDGAKPREVFVKAGPGMTHSIDSGQAPDSGEVAQEAPRDENLI